LQLLNLNCLHTTPRPDPVSTIVYAAEACDVETVIIDGQVLLRDGRFTTLDEKAICAEANQQARILAQSVNRP
jgi:cytosine/adenosine deaminase-related metal-dependent hydrolase